MLPSLLPPLAADAGIILLLRNPPHWWKVRLTSSWTLLCRAEKDTVFWWRASRRGVFFYRREMEGRGPFTAVSRLSPSPCLFPLTAGLPLLWMSLTT